MNYLKGTILDPERFDRILFLTPLPDRDGQEGVFKHIESEEWKKEIPRIKFQDYDDAIKGDPLEFRKNLGTPPIQRAKRLPILMKTCEFSLNRTCLDRGELCVLGSGKLPECFSCPGSTSQEKEILTEIGKSWDEGRFVFILEE